MLKKHKIISCRWLILLQFNGVPTTPDGGRITLKADVVSTDAEMIPAKVRRGVSLKKGVLVSVEDTGIGIAKKNQHKIFSEFSQIEEPYIMQCKDTGLELALSKKLVTLHGGEIWFESAGKGKGSVFSFLIPLAVQPKTQGEKTDKR